MGRKTVVEVVAPGLLVVVLLLLCLTPTPTSAAAKPSRKQGYGSSLSSHQRDAVYVPQQVQALLQAYECRFFNVSTCPPIVSSPSGNVTVGDWVLPAPQPWRRSLWEPLIPYTPKVVVFLHAGLYPGTLAVMEEIMVCFVLSGLYDMMKVMYIGVSGSGIIPFSTFLSPRMVVVGSGTSEYGEFPTYKAILRFLASSDATHRECGRDTQAVVLYLHTKGTSSVFRNRANWRRTMLFYDVWLYPLALILLRDYASYGAYLMDGRDLIEARYPYYSGNYWWARVDYLQRLNTSFLRPSEFLRDRTVAEMWVGSQALTLRGAQAVGLPPVERRMVCLYSSGMDHGPVHRHARWEVYSQAAALVYRHVRASNISAVAPPGLYRCLVREGRIHMALLNAEVPLSLGSSKHGSKRRKK